LPLDGVTFQHADATEYTQGFTATHIYSYDYIFTECTQEILLPLIEKSSSLQMFVCYSSPAKLAAFGCRQLKKLHEMQVTTTGSEKLKVYFYCKQNRVITENPPYTVATVDDFNMEVTDLLVPQQQQMSIFDSHLSQQVEDCSVFSFNHNCL